MKLLCLILFLVLFPNVAIANQLTPTAQIVITETGVQFKNSYTLMIGFLPVALGGISEACESLATRISSHVHGYDNITKRGSINDRQLARSSITYLCIHQNGSVVSSGRIYQIPWNSQTMCLKCGGYICLGIFLKEECEVYNSRSLRLGLKDLLNDYVKEWK